MMRQTLYIIILYAILAAIVGCTTESDRMRMRAGLDSINVRNRSSQPFTVADVQPYVTFFDEHGTPNDRLLAHYLLGLAYSDHGEAPMALQCYQNAVDCADTTATDCDYAQLARVYGQMSEVFLHQGLYVKALPHYILSVKYSWKGKDTLLALRNYEQASLAYMGLKDTASAISVIEEVAKKYLELGYTSDAAISIGLSIRSLVNRNAFHQAYNNMKRYEYSSGFFDSQGNIESGREIYYRSKGLYFLRTSKLDSAEYYFRKELRDGKDFNNQHSGALGLAELYHILHISDSTAKYYKYAYEMSDSLYFRRKTKDVERLQSMYDYTRHQEIANQERQVASNRLILIIILIGAILLLLSISIIICLKLKDIKQKRRILVEKYQQSLDTIQHIREDITRLQVFEVKTQDLTREKEKLIREKEELVRKQEIIRNGMLQNEKALQDAARKQFKSSAIYQKILKLENIGKQPSKSEWQDLQDTLFSAYPNFSELMTKCSTILDDKEYKTCILVRAGMSPGAIASMLGIMPSTVTQVRINLLQKMFKVSGKSKEFDMMLRRIY